MANEQCLFWGFLWDASLTSKKCRTVISFDELVRRTTTDMTPMSTNVETHKSLKKSVETHKSFQNDFFKACTRALWHLQLTIFLQTPTSTLIKVFIR